MLPLLFVALLVIVLFYISKRKSNTVTLETPEPTTPIEVKTPDDVSTITTTSGDTQTTTTIPTPNPTTVVVAPTPAPTTTVTVTGATVAFSYSDLELGPKTFQSSGSQTLVKVTTPVSTTGKVKVNFDVGLPGAPSLRSSIVYGSSVQSFNVYTPNPTFTVLDIVPY